MNEQKNKINSCQFLTNIKLNKFSNFSTNFVNWFWNNFELLSCKISFFKFYHIPYRIWM